MAMNVERNEIDVVHVLRDVMNIITTYADQKTLMNIADVCTSWRDEVLREISKRFYVQLFYFPCYTIGNLDNMLIVNPSASLIFYESLQSNADHVKKIFLDDSVKLPHNAVIMGVDKFAIMEDAEFQVANDRSELKLGGHDHDFAGLLFPHLDRKVHVHFACVPATARLLRAEFRELVAKDFGDKIGLNDDKSTLLLFVTRYHGFYVDILTAICERYGQSHDIMIVGTNTCQMTQAIFEKGCIDCCLTAPENNFQLGFIYSNVAALRISGPNVESSYTAFHCSSPIDKIEQKLQELKEKLKFRRHTTGLLYGSHCENQDCDHTGHPARGPEMMRILKDFFPRVQFLAVYGRRSAGEEPAEIDYYSRLLRDTSVMLITYD